MLADKEVRATYYVCGGLCGGVNLDLPQFEVADLEALLDAGHELGSHTFEHASVLALSDDALNDTIDRNAEWVAERFDRYRMETFAFPRGHWSPGAKRVIAGRFLAGRGVRDGVNHGRVDRAGLSAIGLETYRLPRYDFDALAAKTAAGRGWLIAYGHDVSDDPTAYGCRPADLERLIVAAQRAGLAILPVSEAIATMNGQPSLDRPWKALAA